MSAIAVTAATPSGVAGSYIDQQLTRERTGGDVLLRILRPRKSDPAKLGNAVRSVRIRGRGTEASLQTVLDRLAAEGTAKGLIAREVGEDGIVRVYQHRRGPLFPAIERYFVFAPALAAAKEHANFDRWWADALTADYTAPATAASAA